LEISLAENSQSKWIGLVLFLFCHLCFFIRHGRLFGGFAHTAWVGIAGDPPEVFLALIAHEEHSSRMVLRGALHDRLLEFVTTSSDLRLLRHLNPTELHQVHSLASLRDFDSIGVQHVQEQREFKFGVMYFKGSWNEREMFENDVVSREFEEFLEMMGKKVKLQGFDRYAGGLDTGPGGATTSGEFGLFAEYRKVEIMMHVNNWIPLQREQSSRVLQRKRHLGNDYCVIVFCDANEGPFRPQLIKTKFTCVFIVVCPDPVASAVSAKTCYRVAVVQRSGMPSFGPRLVRPPVYEKGPATRDFLLAKCINGEKASTFAPEPLKRRTELRAYMLRKLLDENSNIK
jgi:hypothetical protein